MRRRFLLQTCLALVLLVLLTLARFLYLEIGRTFTDDPSVWEPEIEAFERTDRESAPPRDAILFVGSSSIRFWDDLAEDMAPMTVIRRGFGGARLSDLIHFADRLILPYAPRAIVLHAGGNELNEVWGNDWITPEAAYGDFETLLGIIRETYPDVPVYYLALRPSRLPGPRDRFLALVQKGAASLPRLEYIDAGAGLALADGSPDPSLIRWDGIHLNRAGYAIWAPPIRERLLRDLGPRGNVE